jgi:hypothetical protein
VSALQAGAERLESLISEFLRAEQQPVLILEIRRVHLGAGGTLVARRGCVGLALPEMPLEPALQPAAHIYAHGGFLGAAFSMVSDPKWAKVGLHARMAGWPHGLWGVRQGIRAWGARARAGARVQMLPHMRRPGPASRFT